MAFDINVPDQALNVMWARILAEHTAGALMPWTAARHQLQTAEPSAWAGVQESIGKSAGGYVPLNSKGRRMRNLGCSARWICGGPCNAW